MLHQSKVSQICGFVIVEIPVFMFSISYILSYITYILLDFFSYIFYISYHKGKTYTSILFQKKVIVLLFHRHYFGMLRFEVMTYSS